MTRGAHPRGRHENDPGRKTLTWHPDRPDRPPGTPTHAPEPPAGPPGQPDLELVTSPHHRRSGSVLPTHVGVVRRRWRRRRWRRGAPHARGGGSTDPDAVRRTIECSPRTRAWFRRVEQASEEVHVLPTHAGVVGARRGEGCRGTCVPHARGGGLDGPSGGDFILSCSPRTWGGGSFRPVMRTVTASCSHARGGGRSWSGTTPCGVGSHARGGGSCMAGDQKAWSLCSPRTWGGSPRWSAAVALMRCSPREWGWFQHVHVVEVVVRRLPTRVGVLRSPRVP